MPRTFESRIVKYLKLHHSQGFVALVAHGSQRFNSKILRFKTNKPIEGAAVVNVKLEVKKSKKFKSKTYGPGIKKTKGSVIKVSSMYQVS